MLIDTHAHLNFKDFKDDADEIIQRSLSGDVWIINVGSQYNTSERAVELAEKYLAGVYAAIGLHPIHAQDEFQYEKYKKLALRSLGEGGKVVAIGEIGLDYKSEYVSSKEEQKEVLLKQLDLAKELNLPVIIHCRQAHADLIQALQQSNNLTIKGVIHCFTGTWQVAQKYLQLGFYLGFNGIIFKLDLDEVIKNAPLERILVETDCPYLTPAQEEGRNEPLYVKYVAEKVAQLKNLTFENVAEATTQNAKNLFKI
ncbi:MAG: TatD family hydrolase [Candidatus Nealsonbacteria bacterium]|nr:TatD family hydrolase [Candidatus Nealsonbacteria bacterium]